MIGGPSVVRAASLFLAPLQRPRVRFFTFVALVALVAIYPTWSSYYGLTVVRDGLVLGILALSLGFLWGKAGLPSFGHAAFFGLGGYTYGLATQHLDPAFGPIVGIVGAVAVGALVGLVLGVFLLRAGVRGALFLIVTVALAQISHQVAISWSSVTGGDGGLIGIPPLGFGILGHEFVLFGIMGQYYLVLAVAVVLFGVLWWVCGRRYGRLLAAIASDERRAETLGINAPLMLTSALTVSTAIAALAGALYVSMAGFMVPDLIGLLLSVEVVMWVLVGSRGSLIGPFIGTFVVWRLSQEISSFEPRLWPLFIGAFFVAMVFVFPGGLMELVRKLGPVSSRSASDRVRP